MKRRIALLVAVAVVVYGAWICFQDWRRPPNHTSTTYLLIEPIGPSEWLEKHRLTLQWRGEEILLPAAFKMENLQAATTGGLGANSGLNDTIQLGEDKVRVLVSPRADIYFSNDFPLSHLSVTGRTLEVESYTRLLIGPPDFLQGYSRPTRLPEDEYRRRLKAYGPIRTVHDD